MRKKYLLLAIVYLVIIVPLITQIDLKTEEAVNESYNLSEPIIIELTGEVAYPGMYTFFEAVDLNTVIDFAGGLTSNADETKINYYELLNRSKKINILSYEKNNDEDKSLQQLIDLNEISFTDLIKYDFMTETRAANIIIYRTQNGRFNSVEDLINVKGIGSVTFENISKYFKV